MTSYPACTENSNLYESDCGSTPWALGLFIAWNVLSMYLMLNIFTGESHLLGLRCKADASQPSLSNPSPTSTRYRERLHLAASKSVSDGLQGQDVGLRLAGSFKKAWAAVDPSNRGRIHKEDLAKFFGVSRDAQQVALTR